MIEVLRLALAALFAVAGVAKLADLAGAATAAQSFGAPRSIARALAGSLAVVETAIAAALLLTATARLAAGGAAALLCGLAVAVAIARLRGGTPDCHCFGRLHSAPAGWGVVARNSTLATVALLVAVTTASPIRLLDLVAFAAVAQAGLVIMLLRRYGRALARIDELADGGASRIEVGAELPGLALDSDVGPNATLRQMLARKRPVLLIFVDPDCGPCHALLPAVSNWQRELRDQLTVVIVSLGDREPAFELTQGYDFENVLVEERGELRDLFGVDATPSAALVGVDGRAAAPLAAGDEAIEELVRRAAAVEGSTQTDASKRLLPRAPTVVAATAGALIATAAAQASVGDATESTQDPARDELQAIRAAVTQASARLEAGARRSSNAVSAYSQASLRRSSKEGQRRAALIRALEAERDDVLALHGQIRKLAMTTSKSYNAQASALIGLSYLAQSLQTHRRAVQGDPKNRGRLLSQSERLFRLSLDTIASAARQMGSP